MMTTFAVVALFLRIVDFPMAPMILGFILGGMMEDNLRRALTISDGSISFLWERPITLSILVLTIVLLLMPLISEFLAKMKKRKES
jgi:putative tricarboxylic transport membrane protein